MSEDPARRENLDEIGEFKGNPFKRRSVPLRWQGVVKVCLGLVVVPVRVMLCTTALCLMLGAIFAVTYGDPPRDLLQPQDRKKRKFVEKVSKLCGKIVMIVMGGWNVEEHLAVDPPEVSAPGTYVIVSNHVSFMDISYHVWRNAPAFIAKAEVSRIPIIGPLARAFQTIFVDRESGTTQSASMQLKSRLSVPGFPSTLVFPEATTSNNEFLLPFHTGAFLAGAPVKIFVFEYWVVDFDYSYCGLTLPALWSILSEPILPLKVTSLPMYFPSEKERNDHVLYANNVRAEIQKVLAVPYSSFTLKDRIERKMSTEDLSALVKQD
mmetsp:Transcript_18966/g.76122  ORF Transcript_18966/g.76122 Transcript_18966/m.76122 type:complete len:322 (+) Transcript_18966:343-1308(+)